MNVSPRRRFCRQLVFGLATSFVGGRILNQAVLADCTCTTQDGPCAFSLNLNDYPALLSAHGSVVFKLPGTPERMANIIVTRMPGDEFYALDSTCAHNQCQVPPYNPVQNAIVCSCHGSRYQANGELINGPAERGLRAFQVHFTAPASLTIVIPELRFRISAASVQNLGSLKRIRLEFPALAFMLYEVRFRASLQQPWAKVPFALYPTGGLDLTEYQGIGAALEIYVPADQAAGFYSIVGS